MKYKSIVPSIVSGFPFFLNVYIPGADTGHLLLPPRDHPQPRPSQ